LHRFVNAIWERFLWYKRPQITSRNEHRTPNSTPDSPWRQNIINSRLPGLTWHPDVYIAEHVLNDARNHSNLFGQRTVQGLRPHWKWSDLERISPKPTYSWRSCRIPIMHISVRQTFTNMVIIGQMALSECQ
jgi:hypothetical protein